MSRFGGRKESWWNREAVCGQEQQGLHDNRVWISFCLLIAPGNIENTNVYQVAIKSKSIHIWDSKRRQIFLQKEKKLIAESSIQKFSIEKCLLVDQLIPIALKKLNITIIGQMYMNVKYTISNVSEYKSAF